MLVNSALQSSAKTISDMYFAPDEYMNSGYNTSINLLSATQFTEAYYKKCKDRKDCTSPSIVKELNSWYTSPLITNKS